MFSSASFSTLTSLFAHSVDPRFGDFYGGVLHPITAIGHLLPMIALSLLVGQQGPRQARWILVVFPSAILVGAVVALFGEPVAGITWLNRFTLVLLGLLVAGAVRMPLPVLVVVAALFGLVHGYENTAGLSSSVSAHLFVLGVTASGFVLVAVVAALAVALKHPWQQIAVRVVGSWIAAIGILLIGLPQG